MTRKWIESSREECRFCKIGAGHAHFDYDRILMESENYFAIASIGGFIEGWTLLCSKRHILNFSSDYCSNEFMDFSMKVGDVVSAAYGKTRLFEHGVQTHGSLTGCGTNHAHLHFVPFQNSLVQQVRTASSEQLWTQTAARNVQYMANGREYLLMTDSLEDLTERSYLSIVSQPQSQFFRRILASCLGMESQADYRSFPFRVKAELTAQRIVEVAEKQSSVATT